MNLSNLVYSTEFETNEKIIPVIYHNRAKAPERGEVFTAQAIKKEMADNLIVDRIKNYTGYVKKNLENNLKVSPGEYYRFEIVAGPHTKKMHNYFYVIPLRKINIEENKGLNKLNPQDYLLIKRLAEFLFGFGWNRRIKKHYKLSGKQDWNWFRKNFM